MELTREQEQGLKIAIERYLNKEKYTVISGYAGTGKSTLVKFIISALSSKGINPDVDVCYTSFTGKACQVLQKKGNKNVSTLHKLLYESFPKPNGGFYRRPKPALGYKIIVVDEVSMVPKSLIDLLFSHKDLYILCLGDSMQLPPISKEEDNHLLDEPNIFLDKIMRQAEQSEIIRLSKKIREGETFEEEFKKGNEVQIYSMKELNTGMLTWADQILTATNATRISVNSKIRDMLGRGTMPENGDKIICLRNYWDIFESPLVNGTIDYLKNCSESYCSIPPRADKNNIKEIPLVIGDFITDTNEVIPNLNMDKNCLLYGEKTLDWKTEYTLNKSFKNFSIPKEFTYGYAITYWKSQGSEWDKVLVIEEKFPYDKETHKKALYTACTRAVEKLVWVR